MGILLKLSELDPSEYQIEQDDAPAKGLRLSQLPADEVEFLHSSEDELKYGTPTQQALAAAESLARGASLGTSDLIQTQLGVDPEGIEGRRRTNPGTSFIGQGIGSVPLAMGIGSTAPGVLGGIFGAGEALSELALSEPQEPDLELGEPGLNAQKLLSHIGIGVATELGVGLGFRGLGKLGKTAKTNAVLLKDKLFGSKKASPNEVSIPQFENDQAIFDLDRKTYTGKKATSIQELGEQVEKAKATNKDILELPEKPEVEAAAARINPFMENIPINDYQLNSLNSVEDIRNYSLKLDSPYVDGKILRETHSIQKKDLTKILDQDIKKIAPNYHVTSDARVAGERVSDLLTEAIEKNRKLLGPVIGKLKKSPVADVDHVPGVIGNLWNKDINKLHANEKIANIFELGDDGFKVKSHWSPNQGITRGSYNRLKEAIHALEEKPKDVGTLFDIRKSLIDGLDATSLDETAKEMTNAQAAVMDYIQDLVQQKEPDLAVRELFKQYAINEENALYIQESIGSKIGSNKFRENTTDKPEEAILDNIFKNSNTVNAYKELTSPKKFEETLADYINVKRNSAQLKEKEQLSANKFYSLFFKNKINALNEAFTDKPESYQKIKDVITLMRAYTDRGPSNPSGTVKGLQDFILKSGNIRGVTEYFIDLAKKQIKQGISVAEVNKKFLSQQDQNLKLRTMESVIKKVDDAISDGTNAIFNSAKTVGISGATQMSAKKFNEISEELRVLSSNPQFMMDEISSETKDLNEAAPNISRGLTTSIFNGVKFLSAKLPQEPRRFVLSPEWKPNTFQLSQFGKYFTAVTDPISALKKVNSGTLDNDTMEALMAVHPDLLQFIRQEVLKHMDKAKGLDYAKKLSLAKFLGQPLDQSMTPQMILTNQAVFNAPSVVDQKKKPQKKKTSEKEDRTSTRTRREEDGL